MLCSAMARSKAFDRDTALLAAIEVFADRGYEGASTATLLEAMGLNRQSLYDTYGSKRQLYIEALGRYTQASSSAIVDDIAAGKTPLDGLEGALMAFIDRAVEQPHPSCLGVSATIEFGGRDGDILAAGETSHRHLQDAIGAALSQAQRDGQIDRDLDVAQASDFFVSTLAGLKVSARSGADRERLRGMARLALRAFAVRAGSGDS